MASPPKSSCGQDDLLPTLALKTSDGVIFEVDVAAATKSLLIKNLLVDLDLDPFKCDEVIPLVKVTGPVYSKVLKWCQRHSFDRDTEEQEDSSSDEEDLPGKHDETHDWDKEFIMR